MTSADDARRPSDDEPSDEPGRGWSRGSPAVPGERVRHDDCERVRRGDRDRVRHDVRERTHDDSRLRTDGGDRADRAGDDSVGDGTGFAGKARPSPDPDAYAGKGRPPSDAGVVGGDDGAADDDQLLDPDGIVDNALTAVVGAVAGLLVGLLGTFVLFALTESGWALLAGAAVWLGTTAHLVRRRTVQAAISRGSYAAAAVLLATPLLALAPGVSTDGGTALGGVLVLLVLVAIPAAVLAAIGWVASRFVPEGGADSVG